MMLQQHVDSGADVTVGCLEVPRMEATGFGVMHVDDAGPHHRLPRKARRSARHARTSPTWRWPAWASTSSSTTFLFDQLRRDAADPALEPRLRQGHHPLPRQARQGGGAPLRQFLRALARRGRGLLARRRHASTPTGRPTSTSPTCPGARPLRRDWPIWTYAEITPPAKFVHDEDGRRGMAVQLAGLGRLHRLRRRAAPARCCSPACTCTPTRTLEEAVVLPDVDDRPRCAADATW